MNNTLQISTSLRRTALIDLALLSCACLVPMLSHLLALPIYKFNPMLLVVLASVVLVRNRWNAVLMAALVPLVSSLVVGMPELTKALLMGAEFMAVVAVFSLMERKLPVWLSMLSAVLVGKVLFYGLKAVVMPSAVLIGTHVGVQLIAIVIAVVLFCLCYSAEGNK